MLDLIFKEDSATRKAEAIPQTLHSNSCTGKEKQMSAHLVSIPSNKIFMDHSPFFPLPVSSALLDIHSLKTHFQLLKPDFCSTWQFSMYGWIQQP